MIRLGFVCIGRVGICRMFRFLFLWMCLAILLLVRQWCILRGLCAGCVGEIYLFLLFREINILGSLPCCQCRPIWRCLSLDLGHLLLGIDFSSLPFLSCCVDLFVFSLPLFHLAVLIQISVPVGILILLWWVLVTEVFLLVYSLLPRWLILLLLSKIVSRNKATPIVDRVSADCAILCSEILAVKRSVEENQFRLFSYDKVDAFYEEW